jgi:Fe-S-cluster-containing dehydrogenase component/formate-dependent nitrite reductase membrane component NrfD
MNFGFVINNETCIGCHACSTACKSENEVPLGVNRTWVKSVETGAFPNVRRHFQVTRCNHCANPPCVRICPVTAMYQRDDGIVEFNGDACIGCKACLQACPYDAIYIDPESGTAAKCHYCSHRTDIGLEPACVVVCPEHAIIAGDMDNPDSEISSLLAERKVTVRRPEQGTAPKLFYIGGNDAAMHPTATKGAPATFAWADFIGDGAPATALHEDEQGLPSGGPIAMGSGRMAEQMVQVAYNVEHRVPWHWPVPAYLVTKAIGAGTFLFMALAYLLGLISYEPTLFADGSILSIVFTGLTTVLLVADLERPERFLRVLTRPQWRSWLTRGAYLLIGFSALSAAWVGVEFLLDKGSEGFPILHAGILLLGIPLATGAAIYTAFLFGQAEGRDLWQSTLLPVHLLVQAAMAGAASVLILASFLGNWEVENVAANVLLSSLVVDLLVLFTGEYGMPHGSESAALAAREIKSGRYRNHYWIGAIIGGHGLPLVALVTEIGVVPSALLVLLGLYAYEYAFVMAPQRIPNS